MPIMANYEGGPTYSGARPTSLRSDTGGHRAQTTDSTQASLNELRKWESALRDNEVWSELVKRGSPSDLLVHLYFLKSEWAHVVRAVRQNQGDKDAMEKLLDYIIQSTDPTWPTKLCEGLEDCSQKLIADLLKQKYNEIDRRPLYDRDMQGVDTTDMGSSMNQPPEPCPAQSLAIIQHRRLYELAVRKHQKDLRKSIDPLLLLKHIPYIQKERIQAAMKTSGRSEATDRFLNELMYPHRDNDWPGDLIKALKSESQKVFADLLQKEYFDLREGEWSEDRCVELKAYYTQQHPTPDPMDTAGPGGPYSQLC